VREIAVGDTERSQLIAEHIGLLLAVLDLHHRAEDSHLWPKLLERGSEEVGPVVQVMEDQHERIEQLTAEAAAALGVWRQHAAAARGSLLADVLDGLNGVLYEHMRMEEVRILPLAEKYVTAAEWHAMAAASGAALPPGTMPLVFGMTLYEADPEVIENTLSSLPFEVRTTLEENGRRAFVRHSERVHDAATPRRSARLKPAQS